LMESCVRLYREGATACASGQRRREEGEEGMAAPMRSQWRAVLAFMASFASFGRVRRARAHASVRRVRSRGGERDEECSAPAQEWWRWRRWQ